MHFNELTLTENEFAKEISEGEQTDLKIRYGVISKDDMVRDLEHWETLLTSSFMQRPHETLTDVPKSIQKMQAKNLKSALAYAALTTPDGSSE